LTGEDDSWGYVVGLKGYVVLREMEMEGFVEVKFEDSWAFIRYFLFSLKFLLTKNGRSLK
jgi:hypothetical protein